jgi:methylated-DNA-[protein]-cysteine S-methyltransferase
MINKTGLFGSLHNDKYGLLCFLTVLLSEGGLIEKVSFVTLNEILDYAVYNNPLSESYAGEVIVKRFKGEAVLVPHNPIAKTDFFIKVYEQLYRIPFGRLMTYKEIATLCGNEKAGRAVGNAMRNNPLPIIYPCHRVVAVNGLGGFSGNHSDYIQLKEKLIDIERSGGGIWIKN